MTEPSRCPAEIPTAVLDVRGLAARRRHVALLERFEALPPGKTFVLVSDHDPRPLCRQLETERQDAFARYLEDGPDVWRVEIGRRAAPEADAPPAPDRRSTRPSALAAVPESRQVRLDVRDEIRRGQEPFGRIMTAVAQLRPDDVVVLRVPFEPVPLYGVLAQRGLAHWAESAGPGDWTVWFYREPGTGGGAPGAGAPGGTGTGAARTTRLDVRGLEPPGPMVRVLERLDALGPGDVLEVLHDRRPMFLYPQLEDRGFAHETDEPERGLVRIRIRRR